MVKGAQNEINRSQINKPVNIEAYKESREVAKDNASGIMYVFIWNDQFFSVSLSKD